MSEAIGGGREKKKKKRFPLLVSVRVSSAGIASLRGGAFNLGRQISSRRLFEVRAGTGLKVEPLSHQSNVAQRSVDSGLLVLMSPVAITAF